MATRRTPGGSGPSTARPGHPGQGGTTRSRPQSSAQQPAKQRQSTRRQSTQSSEPPKTKFTARMGILTLVVAALVISYASSMQAYLDQRSQIMELRASIKKSEAEIKKLESDKARFDDDVFVQSQARARFGWVLPGERTFQVIGRDGKPLDDDDQLVDPSTVAQPKPTAWWSKVATSIQAADHPPKKPEPAVNITPPPRPKQR